MDKNIDWISECDESNEDEQIVLDESILDEDIDIFSKKSGEKTVEERIKTSRSLKIKNNKWNQVDYTEDYTEEKITIDPHYNQCNSTYEDVEFEQNYHKIIQNSKYKELLLGDDKNTVTYQVINDIIIYCYARMKKDYSLTQIFVLTCEYCGVGLATMWKKLSVYLQVQILDELREVSKLPDEVLNNNIKLF